MNFLAPDIPIISGNGFLMQLDQFGSLEMIFDSNVPIYKKKSLKAFRLQISWKIAITKSKH